MPEDKPFRDASSEFSLDLLWAERIAGPTRNPDRKPWYLHDIELVVRHPLVPAGAKACAGFNLRRPSSSISCGEWILNHLLYFMQPGLQRCWIRALTTAVHLNANWISWLLSSTIQRSEPGL